MRRATPLTRAAPALFRSRLSAAADRVLQIPITVALLTAESGDYRVTGLTSNALAFVPGDSSKSFTFEALQDTDTSDETVTLGLGQLPAKVTAGSRTTSVVTIDDDDSVPPQSRTAGPAAVVAAEVAVAATSGHRLPGTKRRCSPTGPPPRARWRKTRQPGVNIGAPVTATDGR